MEPFGPALSWNLVLDVQQMLSYHFMVNALRAGTVVALVAGAIGYFMVLRRQSFAGHTLAVVGFPGAAGATWLGLGAAVGYFGFCIAGALTIASLPGGGRARGAPASAGGAGEESAVVGTVQALALASGFLFVSLYHGFSSGLTSMLFGTITGVSDQQVLLLVVAGTGCLLVLAGLVRPLLFASVDADVALARGVPVRLVDTAFLLLLGVAAAGTSQVTGSLLVFALLVAPAASASRLTARPTVAVLISVLLALLFVWVGEGIAFFSVFPIGFWVTTLAFATFLASTAYRAAADRLGSRGHRQPAGRGRRHGRGRGERRGEPAST